MRKMLLLGTLLLVLAGCRESIVATTAPSDVTVTMRVDPDPPSVGASTLYVTLKHMDGSPIDNAHLDVRGDMDHAGMMPIIGEANGSTNGEYAIPFAWSMGGGWKVTVTVTLPSQQGEINQTFDFFVEAISQNSIINRTPQVSIEGTSEATAELAPTAEAGING